MKTYLFILTIHDTNPGQLDLEVSGQRKIFTNIRDNSDEAVVRDKVRETFKDIYR